MSFRLPTFPGGIHPPDRKGLAADLPIEPAPIPEHLILALDQGSGAASGPIVAAGQRVLRGEPVAEAACGLSARLHAPTSGVVEGVGECRGPSGRVTRAIFIQPDGHDEWAPGLNAPVGEDELARLSPEEIISRISSAGVVGMGGSGLPAAAKLSPPNDRPIDTVIVNGCESEPYLTADYRVMLERAAEVARGLRLLVRALGAVRGVIAVESDKPSAHERLLREVRGVEGLSCRMVAAKYPQGAERQLIRAVLGRVVPSGCAAMDAGAVVHNAATSAAVADAVTMNRPVTERVVAVSGEGVEHPGNLLCRIGTPVGALLAWRGVRGGGHRLVMGGPLTGFAQATDDAPVTKSTRAVLVIEAPPAAAAGPCINCGRCVDGCPQGLLPNRLSILAERGECGEMRAGRLDECIECGACAWQCPARRPILEWIRRAKRGEGDGR